MKLRDAIERIFWTAVAAAGAAVTGAALFDVESWRAAAMAAVAAVIDAVLVVARWRLSVLPNPGAGLPGLPVPKTQVSFDGNVIRAGTVSGSGLEVRGWHLDPGKIEGNRIVEGTGFVPGIPVKGDNR